jgi:tRNA threonylcarbamoyladenosine biosynthesis protein TsaB
LHTTDARASVAVDPGGAAIASVEFAATGAHAPAVLAQVEAVLATAGASLAACDALAVTLGPGSFTGIRIGIATAQGLAAALGVPIWTCGSLMAHAAACHGTVAGPLAVVLDARRGEVFAALYDVTDPVPRVLVPPFCAAPERAAAQLAAAAAVSALTGSGAELVATPMGSTSPPTLAIVHAPIAIAVALARLVRAGACRKSAPRDIEPEYLRKSDAELGRRATRED